MDQLNFKTWLLKRNTNIKVASDIVSRVRRIENELNQSDIDIQYRSDRCAYLLSLFLNMGRNDEMMKYPDANFPIGKYHMSTFRHALNQYILFCDETLTSNKK